MSDVETPDSARPRRPNVDYIAPVASVDLVAFDDDGKPYEAWPCHDCYPWHVEVFVDPSDDRIYLRSGTRTSAGICRAASTRSRTTRCTDHGR
jgi:hypothetical protein